MKRAFLLLLFVLVALYGKLAYDLRTEDTSPANLPEGVLSDIAEKVTAIPLQAADGHRIEKPGSIRQEGRNLFLVSNGALYRFDLSGNFIGQVTRPGMEVAEYVIDPLRKRLIVFGNADEVAYYTFDGQLLERKKLDGKTPRRRMQAVAMYRDCIWTAEERVCSDPLTNERYLEKQLVKYDSSFREMESHRLLAADLPEKSLVPFFGSLGIGVAEDSGMVYAYASPLLPDHLLRDSLRLKYRWDSGQVSAGDGFAAFPLRFGRRFWIASSCDPYDPSQNYTFCFDRDTNRSWQLNGGFEDDFYRTGAIARWQAMDVYSHAYCFYKSGEEVKHLFPQAASSGNPVVFIVKLKV
ncbi:MAG: 6-bladed beta-propeller [Tannerellaceae bacterium]|jgi:hypothetical protein|nr:6-bladed beta-propeller [Tannerellaceae bacterium]